MRTRDGRGINLLGPRRHLKPPLNLLRLFLAQSEPLHECMDEGALLVPNAQVRPRERANEPHQPEAILPIQVLEHAKNSTTLPTRPIRADFSVEPSHSVNREPRPAPT